MSKFDDILTRRPVNRTAALVVSAGVQYAPNTKGNGHDSENPIPTRPVSRYELSAESFVDLTGWRIGRLTVVGIADLVGGKSMKWVVRCDCGRYSTRKAKAIKNEQNTQDRCDHCRHLAYLKREDVWRRTGKDVSIENF